MSNPMRRRRRATALGACAALALGGLSLLPAAAATAATAAPAAPAPACSAVVSTQSWSGGFTSTVTVSAPTSGAHAVGVTLKDTSQRVTQAWGGTAVQQGSLVAASVTGVRAVLGLAGSFAGTAGAAPTAVTVDGSTCALETDASVEAAAKKCTVKNTKKCKTTKKKTTKKKTTKPRSTKPVTSKTTDPTTSTTSPTTSTTTPRPTGTTPVAVNGLLHVCGVNLCNQYDQPIQLRGMSTHGLQWFWQCYTDASLNALANDWKADVLRIAMYVQEKGYETNPQMFTDRVNQLVDAAEARGMYAIIDFHTLTPGDPNYNTERAKTFFQQVASRNKDKKNVIYEIANEPNGVGWTQIKNYADQVIPVIRANDPDAVVIVGTMGWSSLGMSGGGSAQDIISNPLSYPNLMYTFHFYAASHGDSYRSALSGAASRLPMFVTEFGTVTYTGGGNVDLNASAAWLNMLDQLKISYANWTYSDADESSAAFTSGTCWGSDYSSSGVLSQSGAFMKSRISTPDAWAVQ
ncbi:MAG: cellulase family glycosylhydrolase [Kineosporiaceae bacterium]